MNDGTQGRLGNFDRMIRVLVGLAVLCLAVFLEGAQRWWGLAGLLPIATAIAGWCPACALLGLSTRSPYEITETS